LAIDRDHYLMNVRLTLHESMALHLAARLMATRTDKRNPHAAAALRKLGLALERLAPRIAKHLCVSAEVMEDQAQRHDPVYLEVLETLTRAWSDARVARVWHRLTDGRVFEYEFAPYFIEPYAVGQTTHVIGWREPPGAMRTFKLERIQRIELTDRKYSIPDNFDPRDLLADAWGIWYTEAEPVHRSESVEEQADGSLIWRAKVAEPQEMLPWIRGWGADVEVLEPKELRGKLVQETRRLAAVYGIRPIPTYQLLWAKTSGDKTQTHSLIYHLIDVAQVIDALWDHSFPESVRRYFAESMNMDQDSARQWLAFTAGLHDLGKACPAFQRQHSRSQQVLSEQGLSFEEQPVRTKTPHGWVTTYALSRLLPERLGMEQDVARALARAVGGHHGTFPTALELQRLGPSRRGGEDWDAVRKDLFNALAESLNITELPAWPMAIADDPAFWTFLAGLTSFADWLGSIDRYFFDLSAPTLDAYVERSYDQAESALKQLGWVGWNPPTEAATFPELFHGFTPRPLQEAVVSLAPRLAVPALAIIEAPTGEGKTEAALYLADYWLQREQQKGIYVAMPTQATSNQMLGRVRDYLVGRNDDQQVELLLIHGSAAWTEDMEALRLAAINEDGESTVVAHSWFLPKKRSFLAPFAVGTVDQALMSVLQTKHFFVRLFGLSQKTIIFDEIHAYDTYMSTLFQQLLRWLAAAHTTVILLSATLPQATRQKLIEAYTGRRVDREVIYPAVLWATETDDGVLPVATSATGTRVLSIEWMNRDPEALVSALGQALKEGGCAAVLCNTVGRAQDLFQALRKADIVPDEDLILFHARFPLNRRQEIEAQVLERLGKDGARPERAIVVATQVIEQSLDLDFDLMISDMAPVDLILQRAGRLHRHRGRERPSALARPRLVITEPEMENGLPQWGSDGWVYAPYVLLRSYLALRRMTSISIPEDVQPLIEAVYGGTEELTEGLDAGWGEALAEAQANMKRKIEEEQFQARKNLIPRPDDEDVLVAPNRQLDEDNPELHKAWRALTRLARPNVTLVCLYQQADGVSLDPNGEETIDLGKRPTQQQATGLARRVVSVSHYALVNYFLNQDPPGGWRRHSMLRYYRAAIFTEGRCDAGDYWLILDPRLGLCIEKKG